VHLKSRDQLLALKTGSLAGEELWLRYARPIALT
jgi:hypothetical protein